MDSSLRFFLVLFALVLGTPMCAVSCSFALSDAAGPPEDPHGPPAPVPEEQGISSRMGLIQDTEAHQNSAKEFPQKDGSTMKPVTEEAAVEVLDWVEEGSLNATTEDAGSIPGSVEQGERTGAFNKLPLNAYQLLLGSRLSPPKPTLGIPTRPDHPSPSVTYFDPQPPNSIRDLIHSGFVKVQLLLPGGSGASDQSVQQGSQSRGDSAILRALQDMGTVLRRMDDKMERWDERWREQGTQGKSTQEEATENTTSFNGWGNRRRDDHSEEKKETRGEKVAVESPVKVRGNNFLMVKAVVAMNRRLDQQEEHMEQEMEQMKEVIREMGREMMKKPT